MKTIKVTTANNPPIEISLDTKRIYFAMKEEGRTLLKLKSGTVCPLIGADGRDDLIYVKESQEAIQLRIKESLK